MNAHAHAERDTRDTRNTREPTGPESRPAHGPRAIPTSPRLLAIEPIPEEVLDALADELRVTRRRRMLALAIEWGGRILEVIYDGDIERMRARGDDKDVSLRGLAERMDVSPAQLHLAVQVHDFVARHPELIEHDHLTVTHFRCVMPLPDSRRLELLHRATIEEWTTKALEREARALKKKLTRGRGGRPRLPEGIKTLNSMHKYAENPEMHLAGIDDFSRLSPKQARRLSHTLDVMLDRMNHARDELERHLELMGGPPSPSTP